MRRRLPALAVSLVLAGPGLAAAQATVPFGIRGATVTLRLYGPASGDPVIVSSGDGGWIHLAPRAAELLAASGYRVVGLDSRNYLEAFTAKSKSIDPRDEPGDFALLADYASRLSGARPILVGVSEGAGLSVLAASDPRTKGKLLGVVGLGLPDVNELAWRWRDMIIYITKGVPNEPTFKSLEIIDQVSPLPLALIHSTNDEFVPLDQVRRLMDRAKEPKRLWIVQASNHRFSGNEKEFDARLLEAIAWIKRGGK